MSKQVLTIHALGDSIVTAYGDDSDNFIGGWGDHLGSFFDNQLIAVNVYAEGGRSSRSFLNEGRFIDYGNFTYNEFPYNMGPAINKIHKGDYVLIQFGHNDDDSKEKLTYIDRMTPLGTPDEKGIYPTIIPTDNKKVETIIPKEYVSLLLKDGIPNEKIEESLKKYKEILSTYGGLYWSYSCGATYKGYLKYYIDKIREVGAIPILVTPAVRQYFDGDSIIALPGHHGNTDKFGDFPYVRAVRQLASQEQVILLDLFDKSLKLVEMLGANDAKFLQSIKDREGLTIGEARYNRPKKWVEEYDMYIEKQLYAQIDNTHQNRFGSYIFAAFLVKSIYKQIPLLRPYICEKPRKIVACPNCLKSRLNEIIDLIHSV